MSSSPGDTAARRGTGVRTQLSVVWSLLWLSIPLALGEPQKAAGYTQDTYRKRGRKERRKVEVEFEGK